MRLSHIMRTAFLTVFALTAMTGLAAAAFPDRPVTIIVPWAAGGGSDIVTRALQKPLEKALGQTVLVINKEGGSGTIGTSVLAHAKPDGYTVGVINNTGIIHQIHYGGVDYVKDDLTVLAIFLRAPVALGVHAKSDFKTLKDYVDYAKANPGKMLVGVSSLGGGTQLPVQSFFKEADIKVEIIPAKGGGNGVITALAGQHIQSGLAHPSEWYGQVKAGNMRLLAFAEDKRLPNYPDVPTFKELGYSAMGSVWRAFMAPKGIPAEARAVWMKALESALKDPDYLSIIAKLGDEPSFIVGKEAAEYVDQEDTRMLQAIKDLGMYRKNTK